MSSTVAARVFFLTLFLLPGSRAISGEVIIHPDTGETQSLRSIYFLSRNPESGFLRVAFWEYWGDYGIFIDEVVHDDIEGLPHIRCSYEISSTELAEALNIDYVYQLELVEWTGPRSFRMRYNHEMTCTFERLGKSEFLITTE